MTTLTCLQTSWQVKQNTDIINYPTIYNIYFSVWRLVDNLSFCFCSFCHCIVWPSYIYGFWEPIWYLETYNDPRYNRTSDKLRVQIYKWHNSWSILQVTQLVKYIHKWHKWWSILQVIQLMQYFTSDTTGEVFYK